MKYSKLASLVMVFLMLIIIQIGVIPGSGQPTSIRCGQDYTNSEVLPDPFPGSYYHVTTFGQVQPDYIWEFERITQTGREKFRAPFPQDVAQRIAFPRISPDGKKMVFRPTGSTKLLVWDIASGSTAELEVGQFLSEYLMDVNFEYTARTVFENLIWKDSSHLVIQYFGGGEQTPASIQTEITVSDNPLQFSTPPDLSRLFSDVRASSETEIRQAWSPDQNYRVVIDNQGGRAPGIPSNRLFVYKSGTQEPVFSIQSNERAEIVGNPLWINQNNQLFYLEKPNGIGLRIAQIDITKSAVRSAYLNTVLEQEFGASNLSLVFGMFGSNDGQSIGFSIGSPKYGQDYIFKYTPSTGEIIAVCGLSSTGGNIYPFFAPGDNHIAYWDNGRVIVLDLATGDRYQLPGRGVVGWIPSDETKQQ